MVPRDHTSSTNVTFLSTTHISRAGRSATDDACVRLVQGIMKAQTKYKDRVAESPQVSAAATTEPVEQAPITGSSDDPIEGADEIWQFTTRHLHTEEAETIIHLN